MKQMMKNYERVQFIAQGDFLYVEDAPALIRITLDKGGVYELKKGSQIKAPALNGARMTVDNLGDAGLVNIMVGFGEHVPPQRDEIAISRMPKIEIEDGQKIQVSKLPKIEIKSGQNIGVSSMPPVAIKAGQSVAIESQPAIKIAPEQSVAVSNLPDVHLATGQHVSVSNLERVSGAFSSSEVTCPHTFASNGNRKKLIIRALATNENPVKVGALDLAAGEKLTLETTAEVTVTGTDTIQYIEV